MGVVGGGGGGSAGGSGRATNGAGAAARRARVAGSGAPCALTSLGYPLVCTHAAAASMRMRACVCLSRAPPLPRARPPAAAIPLHLHPYRTHSCLLQAPKCTVRVTVLPETSTEGHRVKVAAIILNLQASVVEFVYGATTVFGIALG